VSVLLWAALLSMTAIGELRAGIPVALAGGVDPVLALVVCVIANMLVVPIGFFFLEVIHHRLLHVGRYQSAFDKYMEKARKRTHRLVERYGVFGLVLFTAIPIPITGAYTATLAAWFFGMNKWKAFFSISVGVSFAGILVLSTVLGLKLLAFGV